MSENRLITIATWYALGMLLPAIVAQLTVFFWISITILMVAGLAGIRSSVREWKELEKR